ncbi:hypothetical protein Tco_0137782 [Tanacetum coccineum]
MERKCVTTNQFWKTHKQVNKFLHQGVSQLAEKATKDLIETNLKPCIATTIIKDHDAFRLEVPDLVSQEFNAQSPKIIEDLFKNYVQSNVIQVHPTTTTSTETTSSADLQQQLEDEIHSHHDDHQEDDAPPEGEKRVKRHKASKSSKLSTLHFLKILENSLGGVENIKKGSMKESSVWRLLEVLKNVGGVEGPADGTLGELIN